MGTRSTVILALFFAAVLAVSALVRAPRHRKAAVHSGEAVTALFSPKSVAESATSPSTIPDSAAVAPRAVAAPAPSAPSAVAAALAFPDEPSLMQELRKLPPPAPEVALRLAHEGNERYPDGPDAPERATIVIKSLMGMGRVDDAVDAAKAMVDKYPGTPWAADVKRHVLDAPLVP